MKVLFFIADDAAEGGSGDPVGLVEQGGPQVEPSAVDVCGDGGGGVDGVGFVAHAVDEVGAFPAESFEFVEHGQAVEEVACVDHEGEEDGCGRIVCGGEEVGGEEFHGAGVDDGGGEHGPGEGEAFGGHEHAVGASEEEEAEGDGDGEGECGA